MTRTPKQGRRAVAVACGLALALAPAADARLGDYDPSFGTTGGVVFPDIGATGTGGGRFEGIVTRPDGGPLVAGWAQNGVDVPEALVVQLTAAGALDPSFGRAGVTRVPAGGLARRLHGLAIDAQGRVLAAGDQGATTGGSTTPIVLRFSAGGILEPPASFPGVVTGTGEAHAVAPGPGGTIYVAGGRIPAGGGAERFFVARFTAAGALDTSGFGGGDGIADADFGSASRAEAMAIAPDGDIVLAGWSTAPSTGPPLHRPALARFTEDGIIDEGFGSGGVLNPLGATPGSPLGELRAVQVDAADRMTAAGVIGADSLVIRRLADGGPDPGFGTAGATIGDLPGDSQLHGLALDGTRSVVAGVATPASGSQLVLGSLDASGTPEPRLGGTPPGWRTFMVGGLPLQGLGTAIGPSGTVYTAGTGLVQPLPYVSRHLGNAAPVAALAAPASVVVGAPATFDAAGSSDPEGEALRFAFDLDGDGVFEFDGGQNPLALRSFPAPGTYTVGVRVTDPRGAAATATTSLAVTPAPRPVPRPILGRQGVATPKSGVVLIRLPGTKKFVPITDVSAIPDGTEVDARKGRVLLTVLHDASGRLDGAVFYAGRFIFNQGGGKVPVTTLRLSGGSFAACAAKSKAKAKGARSIFSVALAASVKGGTGARAKKPPRKLWGDGRGRFRTKGRYGAATVRGTKWLTVDRCDGTLVRVARGKVDVEDLIRPRRKVQRVRAGQKTLVPAKRK